MLKMSVDQVSILCPLFFFSSFFLDVYAERVPSLERSRRLLSCRRSLACADRHRPIRDAEVLFPGMFGDVAMH